MKLFFFYQLGTMLNGQQNTWFEFKIETSENKRIFFLWTRSQYFNCTSIPQLLRRFIQIMQFISFETFICITLNKLKKKIIIIFFLFPLAMIIQTTTKRVWYFILQIRSSNFKRALQMLIEYIHYAEAFVMSTFLGWLSVITTSSWWLYFWFSVLCCISTMEIKFRHYPAKNAYEFISNRIFIHYGWSSVLTLIFNLKMKPIFEASQKVINELK